MNQNNRQPNRPMNQFRPERKIVKKWTEGGVTVGIEATTTVPPRYSVKIGTWREDGTISHFIPIRIEGSFNLTISNAPSKVVLGLMQQAEAWMLEEAALRVNDDIEHKIAKETKDAAFGKQVTRVTGKTAKKKAKRLGNATT